MKEETGTLDKIIRSFLYGSSEPLVTTEDGIDIYEGDNFFFVLTDGHDVKDIDPTKHVPAWIIFEAGVDTDDSAKIEPKNPYIKRFSTRKAAEHYIYMNEPIYSRSDIIDGVIDSVMGEE